MDTATIFINNQKYVSGAIESVGVRFDTQSLPAGSSVVGFMTRDKEVLTPPYFESGEHERQYLKVVRYARNVINGRIIDEPAGTL